MPIKEYTQNGREKALPLVFLPGTLCDARVFAPLLERLPDLPTQAVLTSGALSMCQAAEHVLAAIPGPFALLGFSLGGMVAMETAVCAPERVRGLALISTNPRPVPPERHGARRTAVEQARTLGTSQFLREHLWPGYCGATEHRALLPLLEEMAASQGATAFAQQTEMALTREDYRPRLAAVTCPALILAGTADKICPPDSQEELAAALQNSTLVMLPGAGHFPLLEKPDEVASAVTAWFHSLEQNQTSIGPHTSGLTTSQENA